MTGTSGPEGCQSRGNRQEGVPSLEALSVPQGQGARFPPWQVRGRPWSHSSGDTGQTSPLHVGL